MPFHGTKVIFTVTGWFFSKSERGGYVLVHWYPSGWSIRFSIKSVVLPRNLSELPMVETYGLSVFELSGPELESIGVCHCENDCKCDQVKELLSRKVSVTEVPKPSNKLTENELRGGRRAGSSW